MAGASLQARFQPPSRGLSPPSCWLALGQRAMIETPAISYRPRSAVSGPAATGLSAGGGMTSDMLADYPDVFAGGAIDSGLPAQCATSLTATTSCEDDAVPMTCSPLRGAFSALEGCRTIPTQPGRVANWLSRGQPSSRSPPP
jgi:hypothetical protein